MREALIRGEDRPLVASNNPWSSGGREGRFFAARTLKAGLGRCHKISKRELPLVVPNKAEIDTGEEEDTWPSRSARQADGDDVV